MTGDFNLQRVGNGIPIVFLHGYQLDHVCMKSAFEPILKDRDYQRLYFDMPGMGLNKNTTGINHADDLIDALETLINENVGTSPFYIVGMSYGGYLARGLMQRFMTQVKGLFLYVPVVHPLHKNRILPSHEVIYEDAAFTKNLTDEQLLALRELNVVITEQVVQRSHIEIESAIERGDHKFLEVFQANGYEASFDVDAENSRFAHPVTILAGKQDSIVGYEDQFTLSKSFPYASYMAIDCAGHGLHMEQPALFESAVKGWLEQVANR